MSLSNENSRTINTSPFDFAQGERVLIYYPFVVSMNAVNSRTMTYTQDERLLLNGIAPLIKA